MKNEEFDKRYNSLNKEQKDAVDTIEGPVMVIAGPGTGKTTILTLRIANILRLTDTPPSAILALTFTEAGVKAMRSKLVEIIGSRAHEVRIHTFHGFAKSVISEFDDHFPTLSLSTQLTDTDAEQIIRKILENTKFSILRPIGEPDFYVNKILNTISNSKQEAWTPQMIRDYAESEIERIKSDSESISSRGATKGMLKGAAQKQIDKCEKTIVFSQVYEEYEKIKKEGKKIDYDDLIFELLIALKQDKLLLQILQENFLYILVDEHQDTNDAQNLIVKMIADYFESPNLFIVGDEKQAIYRFQGASIENFLNFQSTWKSMKVISLKDNYRSHQSILDASYSLIENNYNEDEYKDLRIKLESKANLLKRKIEVISAENTYAEEECLVNKVKDLSLSEPDHKIAIIVRRNKDIEQLLNIFESQKIKVKAERGVDIFNHPVGNLFFTLVQFLISPEKTELLIEMISLGLWKQDFAEQTRLITEIKKNNIDLVNKDLKELQNLRECLNRMGVIEFLIHAANVSNYTNIASQNPVNSEIWRSIVELSKNIAREKNITDPKKLIDEILIYKTSAEHRSIKIPGGYSDANISIMTAHGSKGLEFDHVFIPFANEESWIRRRINSYFTLPKQKEEGADISDERRLFYVALTRGKESVTILFSSENESGGLSPVRFISELNPDEIEQITIPHKNESFLDVKIYNPNEKDQNDRIEYAKSVLTNKGLSVTALNHFMECKAKFYYKSILKIPEPPTASSEKGNAMHEALHAVWKNSDKSQSAIKITIDKCVSDYINHSLLEAHEKEAVLNELLNNSEDVSKSLFEHFNTTGKVMSESWVETNFSHKYINDDIEISLHGKLDTLIESENVVEVYDYKTREAMSENAIKGETKNDDGNYFRQLIFYKLLLQNNSKYNKKVITPSLVFIEPDSKGRCPIITIPISDADVERVKNEIKFLIENVWSGDLLNSKCDDPNCKFCSYIDLVNKN